MRPSFYLLPAGSLALFVISIALGDYFPSLSWAFPLSSLLALILLLIWGYREFSVLKKLWSTKKANQNLSALMVLVLVLGTVLLSNRPRFNQSLDLTRGGDNSLSKETGALIERLITEKRDIKVSAFFVSPKIQNNFRKLIQLYLEQSAPFDIEYVDPQVDVLRAKSRKLEHSHVVIFESGGKEERITIFNEESISNAILKLLIDKTLDVSFVTGHGEPVITSKAKSGLNSVAEALREEGYRVSSLELSQADEVPLSASLLIIAGPKLNLPIAELKKISSFVEKGGSLLILLDAIRPSDSINQLLEPYGMNYHSDFIVLHSEDPRVKTYGQNTAMINTLNTDSQMGFSLFSQGAQLFFSDARSIGRANKDSEVYFPLVTDSKALQIKDVFSEEDLMNLEQSRLRQGVISLMGLVRSSKGSEGSKSNYIVAFGSSQFILNEKFQKPDNRQLLLKTVNYILRNSYFVSLHKPSKDSRGGLEIASKPPVIVLGFFCFVYPFCYLLLGAIIWYRRRRA
ncbi:MAG: GldG family protein [Oligoflexales bacterium]|nr:GldG family protein [Oligoflexales bacterium]